VTRRRRRRRPRRGAGAGRASPPPPGLAQGAGGAGAPRSRSHRPDPAWRRVAGRDETAFGCLAVCCRRLPESGTRPTSPAEKWAVSVRVYATSPTRRPSPPSSPRSAGPCLASAAHVLHRNRGRVRQE
jgi:hypothetical protein